MKRLLIGFAANLALSALASAQGVIGSTSGTFPNTADTGIYSPSEYFVEHTNVGLKESIRAGKQLNEMGLFDWTSAPLVTFISSSMAGYNMLNLEAAIAKGCISVEFQIASPWADSTIPRNLRVRTIQQEIEWMPYNGDGTDWDAPYAWTGANDPYDPKWAVTNYAIADIDPITELLPLFRWKTAAGADTSIVTDGGTTPYNPASFLVPGIDNSTMFGGTAGAILLGSTSSADIKWNTLALDVAVWRDIIYNTQFDATGNMTRLNNVGLMSFSDGQFSGPPDYVENWSIGLHGQWGEDTIAPRLKITVKPYPGDANLDRTVNVQDLAGLAVNYNATGATWDMGDFNGDGLVNVQDLAILAVNYNWTEPPVAPFVPEPVSLLMFTGAGLLLLRRKRAR